MACGGFLLHVLLGKWDKPVSGAQVPSLVLCLAEHALTKVVTFSTSCPSGINTSRVKTEMVNQEVTRRAKLHASYLNIQHQVIV